MEKTENGKVTVVGVRFRTAGRIYYFDPGDFELTRGNHVIVETARGLEYGYVVGPRMEVDEKNITQPLKPVIRISTEEDDIREKKNREREREAFWICRERIQKRGLEMKLIDAEYTFDNSKVLFYFTADGRVDFRELVKDLAGVFRTRIELRQVGVRDETRRLRKLRTPSLLPHLALRLRPCIHQNGQGTEPVPQPRQNLRRVRQADVLSQERSRDI